MDSIKIVNPLTTFINFPSLIKDVKKSTLECLRNSLALYWKSGDKKLPNQIWKIVKIIEIYIILLAKFIFVIPLIQKIESSFLFS